MKLYSVNEMAEILGVPKKNLGMRILRRKIIPAEKKIIGKTGAPSSLYTEDQFKEIMLSYAPPKKTSYKKKPEVKKEKMEYFKISVMNPYDLGFYVKACCLSIEDAEAIRADLAACGFNSRVSRH